MFRKLFGFGLFVLLLTGLFGGLGGRRSQAAYYEGYADGLQAQTTESAAESGAESAVPPAAPSYRDGRDGYANGRFFGWGILGIFAFFFKFVFFLMIIKMMFWLLGGRRWRHRGGHWGRGHWMHHKHGHGERPGKEKSPKWMDDSDDDEPIMTV